MKISRNWLQEWVQVEQLSDAEIADQLTSLGIEVESIEVLTEITGDVVVGEIVEAVKHPDADSLWLCQVFDGQEKNQVICGAPNVKKGLKACYAKVGATLQAGKIKLKKAKIRGIESFGMLLAEDELGLSQDHNVIIELPDDATVGESILKWIPLNDSVLDLSITPNRGDALSYWGVARELAAALKYEKPTLPVPDPQAKNRTEAFTLDCKITLNEDCSLFTLREIEVPSITVTPYWLRLRLERSGVRSISPLVDISNYVMLETGQPLHFYDRDKLPSPQSIEVRYARRDEKVKTLDGQERTLKGDLLICSKDQPIGLAGVMGGEETEVSEQTQTIYIEAANFDPVPIRLSAKRHHLHSEASHRFERRVDHATAVIAQGRVLHWINQLAGNQLFPGPSEHRAKASEVLEVYKAEMPQPIQIALRTSRIRRFLGMPALLAAEIKAVLDRLDFELIDQTEDQERLLFQVPSYRFDIIREVDLIEEFARLHGYDKITPSIPRFAMSENQHAPLVDLERESKRFWASRGYSEQILFPFVAESDLSSVSPDQAVRLHNPIDIKLPFMQDTPFFPLLDTVRLNQAASIEDRGLAFFTVGLGFARDATWSQGKHVCAGSDQRLPQTNLPPRPIERNFLCILRGGERKKWQKQKTEEEQFYQLKADAVHYFQSMGLRDLRLAESDDPRFHPLNQVELMVQGVRVGVLGYLSPYVLDKREIKGLFFGLELDLDQVEGLRTTLRTQEEEARYPELFRDFSFVCAETVPFQKIEETIETFNRKKHLRRYRLTDIFRGEQIGAENKSMSLRLFFRSDKKTLSDQDVSKEVDALAAYLKETGWIDFR